MILWCLQFWGRSKVEGRFPARLSRVVPKCRSEPVYFVSFFTQEKKKGQSTEVPGPGLLVSRRSRAAPHPRPTVAAPVQGSPGHRVVWPPGNPAQRQGWVAPSSSPLLPTFFPTMSLSPLEVSEIPNFQSSFSISSIYVGFYNGSCPGKVQHLPHTDTGPFPALGISVLCWSNSDSNFKIFSAAMSWQDSTSLPIPWLIRGG